MNRIEAQNAIRNLGGEVTSSISKNTDYIVVGENPGTKLDKAHELNLKIINEDEFRKLL